VDTVDFGDQAQAMFKAWMEAQPQMGESWLRAISPPSRPQPDGAESGSRGTPKLGEVPWAAPTGMGNVSEGLADAYRAIVRMFEVSLPGWTPGVSVPPPGNVMPTFLSEATKRLQNLMDIQLPWGPSAPKDMVELSRLWLDGFQKLSAPWFEAPRPAEERLEQTDGDRSVLSRFSDLYWDAYERTMGRLLESPSVGYRRELDERLLQSFRAWVDFRRASFEYLTVLGETWVRTLAEMTSELESRTKEGNTVTSLVELFNLWTTVADRVLIETFGHEEYAEVQGRLLNASMAYRLEERQTAEAFLKMSHLPSRGELDEVGRELHQLRRDVRDLRKQLREKRRDSASAKTNRDSATAKTKKAKSEARKGPSADAKTKESPTEQASKGSSQDE
jgi:polyhydroxyalkanoate synthase subunit PhaE